MKLKKFRLGILLVLLHAPGLFSAAQDSGSNFSAVHRLLLEMEVPKAMNLLEQIKYSSIYHPYYYSYASFLEVVLGQRQSAADSVYHSISANLSLLKDKNQHSAQALYYQADMYLMLCVLSIQKQEPVKAFSNYWWFYKQQKNNAKKYPDFVLNSRHQLIGQVFQLWISNWLLSDNIDEKGFWEKSYPDTLKSLQKQIADKPLMQLELEIIDAFLQTNFNNNSTGTLNCGLSESDDVGSNPIVLYARALYYSKSSAHAPALKALQLADSLGFNRRIPSFDLLLGTALLNKLDKNAGRYLERFVNNPAIKNQCTYGKLKLAWYYYIFENAHKAQSLVSEILTSKNNSSPQDRQAVYEATHASNWTPELIKSRLLFDGGDYTKSAAVLWQRKNQLPNYNREQKLEYSYRLARAYHQLHDYKKAVLFYEMAIDTEWDNVYYYPCYAAFYLGQVYQALNENDKAEKYFQWCLNLEAPIYQSEIHKRAQKELRKLQ